MPTPLKVAVIGAGLCGLVAARELEREAHEVVVLEKSHRLGGVWVYDPRTESDLLGIDPDREIIHATIYKSLRTNSPRQIMGYSDYMLGGKVYGDPRMFPGHQEFLSYLEDFADAFGVTKLIRFNSEVTRIELLDSGNEFVVEWKTNGMSLTEVFDAVVVCNGHNSQPKAALDIPGILEWPKKQLHAHNYRVPEPFQDQVVVIIGNGSSAYDISRELATVANEVHLSSRSPNVKVSKLENYNNVWQHAKIQQSTVKVDGIELTELTKLTWKLTIVTHAVNRSTGFSPFQVVYSAQPRGPLDLMSLPVPGSVPKRVKDFVEGLHDIHKDVHDNLVRANSKYKQAADQKRRHVEFEEGDFVWAVLTKDRFSVGDYNKLSAKKIGPAEIVEKINSNAYRLKLPSHVRCSDVFNVKHLLPYHGDTSEDEDVADSRSNFFYPGGNDVGPSIEDRAIMFLETQDRATKGGP